MKHSENPDAMRLFFALWPDEQTRMRLAGLQKGIKGRKTRHANLHLTLAFLGEQPESSLTILQRILDELTVPDMHLVIDRIAYFARQRIAWAGMRQAPESLLGLQQALCVALEHGGIAFDRRDAFKPHITLARDAAPAGTTEFEPIVWRARQVSLVHSRMEAAGITYRVLASRYGKPDLEKG